MDNKTKVGIVGTGFIATGVAHMIMQSNDFELSWMFTRRPIDSIDAPSIPKRQLTNSLNQFIDDSDIVFECSGDAIHAAEVIFEVAKTQKKIVTINSEFHVTAGSYFSRRGVYLTEADGDQPGCLARLDQEVRGMGFQPLAYVNLKGFLNPDPTFEEMTYWSEKQKLALSQVVSFTDGTKLQIEQSFVANGLGATIAKEGMIGATISKLEDLDYLVDAAREKNAPISEYLLCPGSPPGVLIVADNPIADLCPGYLPFSRLRTTEDKAYILLRPYHLVHLESLNTLRRVVIDDAILLNNSVSPRITVGAVAKKSMNPGEQIKHGAGGFDVRGKAVEIRHHPDAVPVCLLRNTPVIRHVAPGQLITFDDVDLAQNRALECYLDSLTDYSVTKISNCI